MSPLLQAPPLSIYVHMPWCVRKCPYCDFNSHAAPAQIPQQQYVDSLLADLNLDSQQVTHRAIHSIFFGGGTPSLFSPEEIARVLDGVRARFTLDPEVEITLEANPGTIEHGVFAGYRAAGINRVSLGAQTFNDAQLHALGRIHQSTDIARAVDELTRAGIENFNLDLMYALPTQTIDGALQDVEQALALSPTHLSHYQLTLEPGTAFYHRPPALPDADLAWEMQQQCQDRLAQKGYEQYEVSAYARGHRHCTHNLNYWRFGDYLGIGAGAHGKVTHTEGQIVRTVRTKQPREYLRLPPEERIERRVVGADELAFEFMLNALRLVHGFQQAEFESRTGLALASVHAQLADAQRLGLLEIDSAVHLKPSDLGKRFLNDLQALFLPPDGPRDGRQAKVDEIDKGPRKLVN